MTIKKKNTLEASSQLDVSHTNGHRHAWAPSQPSPPNSKRGAAGTAFSAAWLTKSTICSSLNGANGPLNVFGAGAM